MSCRTCNNSGEWKCVVCTAPWCSNCVPRYTKFRSSGLKCNGCVGISSKTASSSVRSGYSYYTYSVYNPSPVKDDIMEICSECRLEKEKYKSCERCRLSSLTF